MLTEYLDTHSGPVIVQRTGRETVARVSGVRYVEVTGWQSAPMYVPEYNLATDPAAFANNTIHTHTHARAER